MEGKFNSKEQFEQVLYKTIEKTGEISLIKFMSLVSNVEKTKIRELYGVEKVGTKIVEILESNPEKYIFTEKTDTNKNTWMFKLVETNNSKFQEVKEKSVEDKRNYVQENKQKKDVIIQNKDKSGESSKKEIDIKKSKKKIKIAKESDDLLDDSDQFISSDDENDVKPSSIDEKLKKFVTKDMVLINDTFYISKYLVTQELYEAVMGENPSTFNTDPEENEKQERRPVETVSYLDAIEFCKRLGEKCGFPSCYLNGNYLPETNGFRLPTESEWNFVATAENRNSYIYAGSDVPDGFVWYKHNSKTKTHEVGKKNPVMINDSDGIYDMSGNVWEWVMSDSGSDKALYIGGSYEDSEDYLELGKPINKEFTDKETKNSKIGFRICVNFLK